MSVGNRLRGNYGVQLDYKKRMKSRWRKPIRIDWIDQTNLSREMGLALWSVKTTPWGAYFTGIYPVECRAYSTGARSTRLSNVETWPPDNINWILSHRSDLLGIGGGKISGKLGEVTLVLVDKKTASPPIKAKALLLDDDSVPFLIGFEDIMTDIKLVCDYESKTSFFQIRWFWRRGTDPAKGRL